MHIVENKIEIIHLMKIVNSLTCTSGQAYIVPLAHIYSIDVWHMSLEPTLNGAV